MSDKVKVGDVEIISVLDMVPPPREPDLFFPDVPLVSWELHENALEDGMLQLYFGCFFVRSQGKIVLVDTGMGPGPHPDRGNRTGDLLNQLKISGVNADDVDIVVHTHLHGDHVGWNLNLSDGKPRLNFPNARYLVPKLDWEHFTQSGILESAPQVQDYVIPLQELGVMELVEGEHRINEDITTLPSPGHTPGHQVILINSLGEKAMIVGDLLHSKVQVQEPGWCAGVDVDKALSHYSRESVLLKAESEGYIVAAGHFHPTDHIGKVIRLRGRRYWQVI